MADRVKVDERGNLTWDFARGPAIVSATSWTVVADRPPARGTEPFIGIDYESYYSKHYRMDRKTPTWDYVQHMAFDAYLVALDGWTGSKWVRWIGDPARAPWRDVHGLRWIHHNASFDELVTQRLQSDGVVPSDVKPSSVECTADLCTYLQIGRSLESAMRVVFGEQLDKEARAAMLAGSITLERLLNYGGDDARACAQLWDRLGPEWPADERELSRDTRQENWQGVHIADDVAVSIRALEKIRTELVLSLPWAGTDPATSRKAFATACWRAGIAPPKSLSLDDLDTAAWQLQHGRRCPWLTTIYRLTRINLVLEFARSLLLRRRADGTVPFELKYCGAPHTKRWQSTSGLRIQNLDKDDCEGISPRSFFVPGKGEVFIIADLSQIEPRVLNYLAGCTAFLDACRRIGTDGKSVSPYEAHARATMGYTLPTPLKDTDPGLYALAKARTLALGYQAWTDRYIEMARTMAGIPVLMDDESVCERTADGKFNMVATGEQLRRALALDGRHPLAVRHARKELFVFPAAKPTVLEYRRSAVEIVALWARNESTVRSHVGGNCVFTLPSGSRLYYWDITEGEAQQNRHGYEQLPPLKAWVLAEKKNPKTHNEIYGGKVTENQVQLLARDVFAAAKLRVKRDRLPGLRINWHCHDELVARSLIRHADANLARIRLLMSESPTWAPELPVGVDAQIADRYLK